MAGPRLYYLHTLLVGQIGEWAAQLDRAAAMGFDAVAIPPPFVCGRSGNLLLTADHRRSDGRIGRGDATALLARYADAAGGRGLSPLLDLVIDRVAAELPRGSPLARWYRAETEDEPPDPRCPSRRGVARLAAGGDDVDGLADWWAARVGEWCAAGIGGFRCLDPERAPALWQAIIARVRAGAPGVRFIAWSEVPAVAADGFDYLGIGIAGRDDRADWFANAGGDPAPPAITSPEVPFARRVAADHRDSSAARLAARRALDVAASCGAGWLMPMGFEFGAGRALDPMRDRPEDFARLVAEARFDLTAPIAAANARRADPSWPEAPHPPRVLSAPHAPVLALLAGNGEGSERPARLIVVNARLDRPTRVAAAPLLVEFGVGAVLDDRAGNAPLGPAASIALAPGEVRVLALRPTAPVAVASVAAPREAAAQPRIAVEAVTPAVDDGRFPVNRLVGELVEVAADLISDGHERVGAALLWRPEDEPQWREAVMEPVGNDRWVGRFPLARLGMHRFTVIAWRDRFASFADELETKHAAGLSIDLELEEGRLLLERIAAQAKGEPARSLTALAAPLAAADAEARRRLLLAPATAAAVAATRVRLQAMRHPVEYPVLAERRAAGFASWYEMFPRSQSGDPARHGNFDDVIARLPAIREMGFDVLYFPPIHPVGRVNRKGRNNSPAAEPDDPGSPYAIGSAEGGHDAIHPALGTLADFRRLREAAAAQGIELALDFAIQCAPDHPWLREHPDWFDWRPDGSLRYAENPPKKYEDIVNVDFYATGAVPGLWAALRDIVLFWAGEGIRLFRVDNPHTKPLPFWEWLIADIRREYPDAIFLAEAFTRPKLMYRLAKIGFSQSYTYFTWRNSKAELTAYLTELTISAARDFFRPHFFVNTPDINPAFLQTSGRAGFLVRAVLAATLSGLFGMYSGFELCEARALPGREEYLDSEKYQIRVRDPAAPGNIVGEIGQLNRIRRGNPALHTHLGLEFHNAFNDSVLYYAKATPDLENFIAVAVNLDPHFPQDCDIEVPLWRWGLPDDAAVAVEELMSGNSWVWYGKVQRIRLDPAALPFAIWRLRPAAGAA